MSTPGASGVWDFDLHGLVGVRLIQARPEDAAAVRRQLGPIERPLGREPDIVIRFVPHVRLTAPVLRLGDGDVGFTTDPPHFYVLRGPGKSAVRVRVPMDALGGPAPVEIVCQRGAPAVPLLVAMVNLTALARGALPLHAAAFRWNGAGVVVTGWARGGKTELLLAFAARGAEYVGDEWVYLVDGGSRVLGLPEPVRVRDWHLDDLPAFRRRVPHAQRVRLAGARSAAAWLNRLALTRDRAAVRGGWRAWARSAGRLADGQRSIRLPPRLLFGDVGSLECPVDTVILVGTHDEAVVHAEPTDAETVAARMAASLEEERKDLVSCYRRFRFAFPDRRNPCLDRAAAVETERLREFLAGRRCFSVLRPDPVPLTALYEAVRPLLQGRQSFPAPVPHNERAPQRSPEPAVPASAVALASSSASAAGPGEVGGSGGPSSSAGGSAGGAAIVEGTRGGRP